jgi:imidazole glycerol-phosphate synthase subunit HisF
MLRKRVVGVVTVRGGWAVQSFGYARYLPVGRPEVVAENLDRWGADEILLQCIDRSTANAGPDLALLERVANMGLGTPLILAGGIRNEADGVSCIHAGADRVCVDALLHERPEEASELSNRLGAQAVIAALPLSVEQGGLRWFDYRTRKSVPISERVLQLLRDKVLSEALVIDWKNEGTRNGFDMALLAQPELAGIPLIAFGGLGDPAVMRAALEHPQTVAAGVGNALNYREHAVRVLKQELGGVAVRSPSSARGVA